MTTAIFNEEAMSGFAQQLRGSEFRQFWQSRVAYEVAIHYTAMENYIEESLFGLRLLKEFGICSLTSHGYFYLNIDGGSIHVNAFCRR